MVIYVRNLFLILKIAPMLSTQVSCNMKSSPPYRFKGMEGLDGRTNDIIYHPSLNDQPIGTIIFFGGDVQDYSENMMSHRDNKLYVKWNLESTSILLHNKFPSFNIFVIRAARMHLKTFGCYENFVEGNDFGAPNYSVTLNSLMHLKMLLTNATVAASEYLMNQSDNSTEESLKTSEPPVLPLYLIGFSKGCVVLNQLLFSLMALSQKPNEELQEFVESIKVIYWLDGAHCGSSDTWVTDKSILKNFSTLSIKIRIHVTPYQVCCDMRPRIGKEEKNFRETLRKLGADIQRTLHFEDEPRSVEYHFKVLEEFN